MSRFVTPSKRSADAQEAAWVADEDHFVLQQAKKKAVLRLKAGRAQPIDWLAVALAVIDPAQNPLDEELEDEEIDVKDPESVFDGLKDSDLGELEKGVEGYLTLETSRGNREYWTTMKAICDDHRRTNTFRKENARGVASVAADLDKLLAPKTLPELEKLEKQVKTKLDSDEVVDTDYWEHLLKSLLTYKAKAKLRSISKSMLNARQERLRLEQSAQASKFAAKLAQIGLHGTLEQDREDDPTSLSSTTNTESRHPLDPEPMLRLRPEDRALEHKTEDGYAKEIAKSRQQVLRRGYIARQKPAAERDDHEPPSKRSRPESETVTSSQHFDREVARGLGDNEEIMTTEEPVETKNRSVWANQYRPRKPRHFNRVQLGYEWNKYNQTHYDHDNPPPKVVQGYRFNIFYPDLVDIAKAPTYRIERENGRKRGQTFAPAGEDDTCLIRFTAGPPYEDIAFRIVDREWDFSAKRERGFRSTFDKGVLQLHFQFKKIYYRK